VNMWGTLERIWIGPVLPRTIGAYRRASLCGFCAKF
jgi:hypothetical protein